MASPVKAGPAPVGVAKKVVLIGNSGTGKTALALRFVHDVWSDDVPGTIGGSYMSRIIQVDGNPFTFQIWDTAGQERFRSMVRIYYRGASAAVLCCDLTDAKSLATLPQWVDELKSVVGSEIVLAIACTKGDKEEREVTVEEVEEYAKTIDARVTVTSAKTYEGVEEAFTELARILLARMPPPKPKSGSGASDKFTEEEVKPTKVELDAPQTENVRRGCSC